MNRIDLAFATYLFKSMSVYFPSLWIFPRLIATLDSFTPSCLMKLRKLSVGRSKLTQTLCKRKGDSKKTKEQLKLSAKPFKNCRYVDLPSNHVFFIKGLLTIEEHHTLTPFDMYSGVHWVCVLSLQFGNESLSVKLEEQIGENEDLRNKYVLFEKCTETH